MYAQFNLFNSILNALTSDIHWRKKECKISECTYNGKPRENAAEGHPIFHKFFIVRAFDTITKNNKKKFFFI